MLRNKGTNKISELQASYTPHWVNSNNILSGFKALKLTKSFSEFKNIKERGYGFKDVLSVLIWGLFLEMLQTVADIFEIDADELLGKMLTDPIAEQRLSQMLGNCLREAG